MAVGDVEAVGSHCQVAYCHQLDFLPFKCESCHGKFCLDHRSETTHQCAKAGAWATAKAGRVTISSGTSTSKPSLLNHDVQCALPLCKTLIDTALVPGVHCQTCNRRYCLKHRMGENHDCANIIPLGARPRPRPGLAITKEKGLSALDKLKSWSTSNKSSAREKKAKSNGLFTSLVPRSRATAATNLAAINALKTAAKGDAKIPAEKRIYLHVEASADTTKAKYPTGKFFYSKDLTVGRVLDVAAKALQVENVNNRGGGEDERLRVFHVEAGRLLDFSEKLGDCAQTGNTLILLRGVGPPIPDFIEL